MLRTTIPIRSSLGYIIRKRFRNGIRFDTVNAPKRKSWISCLEKSLKDCEVDMTTVRGTIRQKYNDSWTIQLSFATNATPDKGGISHPSRHAGLIVIPVLLEVILFRWILSWTIFARSALLSLLRRMRLFSVQSDVGVFMPWIYDLLRSTNNRAESLVCWHRSVRQSQVRKNFLTVGWNIQNLVPAKVLSRKIKAPSLNIVNYHDFELGLLSDVSISSLPISRYRYWPPGVRDRTSRYGWWRWIQPDILCCRSLRLPWGFRQYLLPRLYLTKFSSLTPWLDANFIS